MFRQLLKVFPKPQRLSSIQFLSITSNTQHSERLGILGAPFNKGQPRHGVAKGPDAIRGENFATTLESLDWHVKDYGDIKFAHAENDQVGCGMKYPRTCGLAMQKISTHVEGIVSSGETCLTLGGDHSIAIGTIHGHLKAMPDACVVWIDAHADLNTVNTTGSGNAHGMPLSFLLHELESETKEIRESFEEWSWLEPCLSAKNLIYIGLRDVDSGEQEMIRRLGINYFCMHDIDKLGIGETTRRALKAINPNLDRPIHLSYDIDALDPHWTPSTGTPVTRGLTLREGLYIAEEFAATGKITAMDMVEVNPDIGGPDAAEKTARTAKDIIISCFGQRIV